MAYAIGTAGQKVRLYVERAEEAEAQRLPGEVAVAGVPKVVNATIAADGGSVTPPSVPELPASPLTMLDFLLLFTPAEFIAIKAARARDPHLDYFWTLMEAAASAIRLENPLVVSGVQYLGGLGLLAADRVTAVLAGEAP